MSNPVGGGSEKREKDQPIPAGEYLLSLVWFDRRVSQAGNPYLRCGFVVCAGPKKGERFFCPWSLDTSKPGCRQRWELWMEAVDCGEQIDLDNDRVITETFKGRCFKAEVKHENRNGYEGNDLARLVYRRHWTAADWKAIKSWDDEWKQRHGWQGQDPSADPQAGGEQPPPSSEPQWSDGRFDPDSDDESGDAPF